MQLGYFRILENVSPLIQEASSVFKSRGAESGNRETRQLLTHC